MSLRNEVHTTFKYFVGAWAAGLLASIHSMRSELPRWFANGLRRLSLYHNLVPSQQTTTPGDNHLGATLFILYMILALLFTSMILHMLVASYTALSEPQQGEFKRHTRVRVLCIVAPVSFALLSYNMVSYLVLSFQEWRTLQLGSGNLLHDIWRWTITSTLFTNFAKAIAENPGHPSGGFPSPALTTTLWAMIYMGVEGRRRGVHKLWYFFVLAEILPISFAFSLFLLALELKAVAQRTASTSTHGLGTTSVPSSEINQRSTLTAWIMPLASVFAYNYLVGLLHLVADKPALIPIVLLLRVILIAPLFFPPNGELAKHVPALFITLSQLQGMAVWPMVQDSPCLQSILAESSGSAALCALNCDFILMTLVGLVGCKCEMGRTSHDAEMDRRKDTEASDKIA